MPKTFTEKELREAIKKQNFLTYEEQEEFARQIGVRLEPRKAEAEGYIFSGPWMVSGGYTQHNIVLCKEPSGITGGNKCNEPYIDLFEAVNDGFGEWVGGTKVKITIEEVLD